MQLGVYRIISKIAVGGMAEIFVARHEAVEGFARTLVIKRILPEYSEDPEFVRSFLNEAKLAAQLNHPNIVQIYDLGRIEGAYFIAMEYLPGPDLSALLRVHRRLCTHMPLDVAMRVFADVCAGLHFAHHATDSDGQVLGVVHRDVTPSNVIVGTSGVSKLLDFGVAKATARGDGKTKTGTIKGKIAYLAPEQLMGADIDMRVDVFAAGIMLNELLTNENPFKRETEYQTLQAIASADGKILDGATEQLSVFRPILEKALAQDRDQRYRSCAELWAATEIASADLGLRLNTSSVIAYLQELQPALDALKSRAKIEKSELEGKSFGGVRDQTDTSELTSFDKKVKAPQRRRTTAMVATVVLACAAVVGGWLALRRAPSVAPLAAVAVTEDVTQGSLRIVTSPPGARVVVFGTAATDVTPLDVTELSVGTKGTITATLLDYAPSSVEATVTAGRQTLYIGLTKAERAPSVVALAPPKGSKGDRRAGAKNNTESTPVPAAESGPGRLRVTAQPWGTVKIDGVSVGETPIPSRELSPGMHAVVIENPELNRRIVRQVKIIAGKEIVLSENFTGE